MPIRSLKGIYYDADAEVLVYLNNSGEYVEISTGSVSIPTTAYASNSEAVTALGVGVLYKTTIVGADGIQPLLSVTI